jgi:hypothetical protein
MTSLQLVITDWINGELFGSLWLAMVVILLFGITVYQNQSGKTSAGALLRAVFEASAKSFGLAALVGMVYFLLASNFAAFENVYGAFSKAGTLSYNAHHDWTKIYGNNFFAQQDMEVTQYTLVDSVEPLPESPALYKTVQTEKVLAENSISRFRGSVYIQGADWKNREATFNAYAMDATYEYDVVNNLSESTHTRFHFPLFGGSKLYQGVSATINGNDAKWKFQDDGLTWEYPLNPGEKATVVVKYQTWSMDGYSFRVEKARDIQDFNLTIAIDTGFC